VATQHTVVGHGRLPRSTARNVDEPLAEQTGALRRRFGVSANFILILPVHFHNNLDRAIRIRVSRNLDALYISDGNACKLNLGAVAQPSGFREIGFEHIRPGQETDRAADEEYTDHQHDEAGGNHEPDTQLCPFQLFTLSHRVCPSEMPLYWI